MPAMRDATTALLLAVLGVACDGGKAAEENAAKQAADAKATEELAAKKLAEENAAKAEAARKLEDEEAERAYAAAKVAIEPLARLPKKHPKGFAAACVDMLAGYDAFMTRTLEGDALAAWTGGGSEDQLPTMRRACHLREVNVVVCETEVLKTAAPGTELAHIIRACQEKFAG